MKSLGRCGLQSNGPAGAFGIKKNPGFKMAGANVRGSFER